MTERSVRCGGRRRQKCALISRQSGDFGPARPSVSSFWLSTGRLRSNFGVVPLAEPNSPAIRGMSVEMAMLGCIARIPRAMQVRSAVAAAIIRQRPQARGNGTGGPGTEDAMHLMYF